MNENETQNTPSATEQSPQPQSLAAAATPDPTTDGGTPLAGPPSDGEGCQGVTVIVAETTPGHPEYARLAARTVKVNLVGVDAVVAIMAYEPPTTLAEALLRTLNEEVATERIVLMTDHMALLQPTSLAELGCRRGELTERGVTVGECLTPKLMYRSVLLRMLPEMIGTYAAFDPLLEYDEYARPQVMPVIMHPWRHDNWLLPVGSASPDPAALAQWGRTQRFLIVKREEWPGAVVEFIEKRFPE